MLTIALIVVGILYFIQAVVAGAIVWSCFKNKKKIEENDKKVIELQKQIDEKREKVQELRK